MDADRRLQQKSDRKEKRVVERIEFIAAQAPCGVAPHGACNESATQRSVIACSFVLMTEVVSAAHDTVPKKGVFGSCGQTGDPSPELVAQIKSDAEHVVRAKRQVERTSERPTYRQATALSVGGFHIGADVGQPQPDDPAGTLHSAERPRDRPHRYRTRRLASVSPRIPDRNGRNGPVSENARFRPIRRP